MDLYLFYKKKMSKYCQDGIFELNSNTKIRQRTMVNDRIVLDLFKELFKEEKLSFQSQKDMNNQILINEINHVCNRLNRDLKISLMKTTNIIYLGKVLYCYVKQLHVVNLLQMMVTNIRKYYVFFKRVLLYPVFRDWVSLRSFIEEYKTYILTNTTKFNYEESEFYLLYKLELQRSGLENLVI